MGRLGYRLIDMSDWKYKVREALNGAGFNEQSQSVWCISDRNHNFRASINNYEGWVDLSIFSQSNNEVLGYTQVLEPEATAIKSGMESLKRTYG